MLEITVSGTPFLRRECSTRLWLTLPNASLMSNREKCAVLFLPFADRITSSKTRLCSTTPLHLALKPFWTPPSMSSFSETKRFNLSVRIRLYNFPMQGNSEIILKSPGHPSETPPLWINFILACDHEEGEHPD